MAKIQGELLVEDAAAVLLDAIVVGVLLGGNVDRKGLGLILLVDRCTGNLRNLNPELPAADEWFSCSAEELVVRRCLRWVSLRNAPVPARGDQETITVYLPEKQVLTSEALRKLARTRSLEQWINYDVEGSAHAEHD